ncbi:hypothetical protein GCM10011575_17330 [Microlunatus endophyticus]|uniref:Sulfotransferase domain-containing protein n=1 Tax=Microlunatus endophyticus TaxID=1716077 RepID=A0A917S539_9ACTN|nr:sulfotransferase domain-containing protein [Microlunatus endophyticus]GGL59316.1 hypothetical protein GCM10011575_17330 [Microlunatus endophyticus]
MPREIPDFIIIGAMKCGTTTLYQHLASHPGVFMSTMKEPNFFVERRNWSRGFDWYRSLFADAEPGALLGEATTNYTKSANFPGVPRLIHQHAPNAKLIYLLRDPVERIRSHYAHTVVRGRSVRPPAEAIRTRSIYVRTSLYGRELLNYRRHFPADQILVLLTEDLRDDPAGVLARTAEFLGLDPYDNPDADRHYHVTPSHRTTNRLGVAVDRRPRLSEWSERRLPERLRERLLTRPAPASFGGEPIPGEVIDRVSRVLAADRRLLLRLVDLDLRKWAPLHAPAAS